MPWRRQVRREELVWDRSLVVDVAVGTGFAGLMVADVLGGHLWPGPRPVTVAMAVVSGLALIWRRRSPLAAFTAVVAAEALVSVAFGHYEAGSCLLVGLLAAYSVAAYGRNLPFALAVTAAFVVAFNVPHQPIDEAAGDAVFTVVALALAMAIGVAMRSRVERASAMEARAQALERQQEEFAAAAAAEERRRIARELHDIISHSLGVVVLQAGAADQVLERNPEQVREALAMIRRVGQEAIGEMGTLVGLMRDGATSSREPQPSLAELERLVATTRDAGLPVDLVIEGHARPLPAAVELSAFRVIQEGLTNAIKHAGPAHARVLVRYRDHELEVEVADDGTGSGAGPGSRHGLAGVRERVAVFGGRFQAGPRPAGGWELRATFPVGR